jgi:hypothetical protein
MVHSIFKSIDMFKVPATMYITRENKKTKARSYSQTIGSFAGSILTLSALAIALGYLAKITTSMLAGQQDTLSSSEEPNNFDDAYRSFTFDRDSTHIE